MLTSLTPLTCVHSPILSSIPLLLQRFQLTVRYGCPDPVCMIITILLKVTINQRPATIIVRNYQIPIYCWYNSTCAMHIQEYTYRSFRTMIVTGPVLRNRLRFALPEVYYTTRSIDRLAWNNHHIFLFSILGRNLLLDHILNQDHFLVFRYKCQLFFVCTKVYKL